MMTMTRTISLSLFNTIPSRDTSFASVDKNLKHMIKDDTKRKKSVHIIEP